jgi:hypothetical protein
VSDIGAEKERIQRLVKRTGPSSFLSDTKWRKALKALQQPDLRIEEGWIKFLGIEGEKPISIKSIYLDYPHAFIGSMEFGIFDLLSIEWLRIPSGHSDVAVRTLSSLGQFRFERTEEGLKIIGHRVFAAT